MSIFVVFRETTRKPRLYIIIIVSFSFNFGCFFNVFIVFFCFFCFCFLGGGEKIVTHPREAFDAAHPGRESREPRADLPPPGLECRLAPARAVRTHARTSKKRLKGHQRNSAVRQRSRSLQPFLVFSREPFVVYLGIRRCIPNLRCENEHNRNR